MSTNVNVRSYRRWWDPRSSCGAAHFKQLNPAMRDSASFRRPLRHIQGKPVGRSCPDDALALASTDLGIAIGAELSLKEPALNGYQKSSTRELVRYP